MLGSLIILPNEPPPNLEKIILESSSLKMSKVEEDYEKKIRSWILRNGYSNDIEVSLYPSKKDYILRIYTKGYDDAIQNKVETISHKIYKKLEEIYKQNQIKIKKIGIRII